jgi:hypothetical protein
MDPTKLKEIDEIWDPIIAKQRRIQGEKGSDLIRAAAEAEDQIPYEELEAGSRDKTGDPSGGS